MIHQLPAGPSLKSRKCSSAKVHKRKESALPASEVCTFDDERNFVRGNPFLVTRYRTRKDSYSICIKSILHPSNESMNIFSALVLIVFNAWLAIGATCQLYEQHAPPLFIFSMAIHGVVRSLCWFCSFGMHVNSCHSPRVYRLWEILDYSGIYFSFISVGSHVAIISMFCEDFSIRSSVIICGTGTALVALYFSFSSLFLHSGILKAAAFVATLVIYISPISYYSWHRQQSTFIAYAILFECIGGCIFVLRFPERYVSEKLDFWLPSHSLWHWFNLGFDYWIFQFVYEVGQDHVKDNFVCPAY